MAKKYHLPVSPNTTEGMRARLNEYKKTSHQKYAHEEWSVFSIFKRRGKISHILVPATWMHILVFAFVYAVGINIVKHIYYAMAGKPEFVFSDPKAEENFARLKERFAGPY